MGYLENWSQVCTYLCTYITTLQQSMPDWYTSSLIMGPSSLRHVNQNRQLLHFNATALAALLQPLLVPGLLSWSPLPVPEDTLPLHPWCGSSWFFVGWRGAEREAAGNDGTWLAAVIPESFWLLESVGWLDHRVVNAASLVVVLV